MHDKIALLMEETGCDRGEAELALEMCGYEVEKAVQAIPRLLKNIAVLRGKFIAPEQNQFGLLLVVLNLKSRTLLRARAVLSYNPAVYTVALDKDWFEFEKDLYACRLWEGSLQNESQDIEQRLGACFRGAVVPAQAEEVSQLVAESLKPLFAGGNLRLSVVKEVLDLGSFQSLRSNLEAIPPGKPDGAVQAGGRAEEPLLLKIVLEEDPEGPGAAELRAGDIVSAQIHDSRDIAQYLARLLGGYSEKGPQGIAAPVEAIESGPAGPLVRVRFAVGVCGDAALGPSSRVKLVRKLQDVGAQPWWRRFF